MGSRVLSQTKLLCPEQLRKLGTERGENAMELLVVTSSDATESADDAASASAQADGSVCQPQCGPACGPDCGPWPGD